MNKSEFMLSLNEALGQLPEQVRTRILDYFEEIISDRTESGMTEEEAVAALGSIEDILKEIAPELLVEPQNDCSAKHEEQNSSNPFVFSESIDSLDISSANAKLSVQSEELPNGITARVDYQLPADHQCICSLKNGKLEILHKKTDKRNFSLLNLFNGLSCSITITLNSPALVGGKIKSVSGNVNLSKLVFTDSLDVHSASGDIDARDVAVQNNCKLHTSSGEIEGRNLTCGELLEIHTSSGDAELYDSRAGKIHATSASGDSTFAHVECDILNTHSASGDVDARHISGAAIAFNTSSGDLTLIDSVCAETIEMNSTSGDIAARNIQCSDSIQMVSSSGDIHGNLCNPEDYTFQASSRTGDITIPHTSGPRTVIIRTISGDIKF